MNENFVLVGDVFEQIEIVQTQITGVFRDNDSDPQGIIPFFNAPTFCLVELSFDDGERQGLWMGQCAEEARRHAKAWAQRLGVRVVDRTMKRAFH
ncbi:hypothetical protein FY152_04330 [Agrobacterium tumefaciens]|nr:hypothetical protein FY152_04330 [Agrobacterium tumefaciens]